MVEERFYFSTGGVVVSWFCKWVKIPRVFPTMHVHIQHLLRSALRGVECFSALIAPDRQIIILRAKLVHSLAGDNWLSKASASKALLDGCWVQSDNDLLVFLFFFAKRVGH